MNAFRSTLKRMVEDELANKQGAQGNRIGHVSKVNGDGTALILVDGGGVLATLLFPVVQGQEVIVMPGTDGTYRTAATRPNPVPTVFEQPSFFSGGALRFAWQELNSVTNPFSFAIRYQDTGSDSVFRWLVLPGSGDSRFVKPSSISFSPDGTKSIYGGNMTWNTQTQGVVPFGANTKIAVVPLGKTLTGTVPIPSFPKGFSLSTSEGITVYLPGFDIAAASLPAPVDTFQIYTYEITDVFVSNDGNQIFWTEYMFLRDFTPSVDIREYTFATLCTLVGGIRTILGSIIPDQIVGAASGSGLCGVLSQFIGRPTLVPTGSFIWDPLSENGNPPRYICEACRPTGWPGSFGNPSSNPISDFFAFNVVFGLSLPSMIALEFANSTIDAPTYSKSHTGAMLRSGSSKLVVYEDRATGTFKQYSLLSAATFSSLLFGETDANRGSIQQDPDNINAVILTKVITNDLALTVTVQTDKFLVTPSPVDTGLTKFNFRTANYDDFVIVPNLINGGPITWGIL